MCVAGFGQLHALPVGEPPCAVVEGILSTTSAGYSRTPWQNGQVLLMENFL